MLHRPQKKNVISSILCTNLRLEAPLPRVFFLYDIPSFCHNSSHTCDPKMHHPAKDPLVLSLRCGKATTVFVLSKDCDIVADVPKCGSSGLDFMFCVLYSSNIFTAVRARTRTSRDNFFVFFSGSCSRKQACGTI